MMIRNHIGYFRAWFEVARAFVGLHGRWTRERVHCHRPRSLFPYYNICIILLGVGCFTPR